MSNTYTIKSAKSGRTVTKQGITAMIAFLRKMHTSGMHGTYEVTQVNSTGTSTRTRTYSSVCGQQAMVAIGAWL